MTKHSDLRAEDDLLMTISWLHFLTCSLWSTLARKWLGCSNDSLRMGKILFLIKGSATTWRHSLSPEMLSTHGDIVCWHPTAVVHFWTLMPVVCPLGDQAHTEALYKIFKTIWTLLFSIDISTPPLILTWFHFSFASLHYCIFLLQLDLFHSSMYTTETISHIFSKS